MFFFPPLLAALVVNVAVHPAFQGRGFSSRLMGRADAVAAEPYAEDDVKDALARVRVATEALQEMMQRLLLEALRNTRTAA